MGGNVQLNRISGHANTAMQQYKQITTIASTDVFHAFMPVNGDATLSVLTDIKGTSRLTDNYSGTYYQNVVYFGSFNAITASSGEVLLYLGEQ